MWMCIANANIVEVEDRRTKCQTGLQFYDVESACPLAANNLNASDAPTRRLAKQRNFVECTLHYAAGVGILHQKPL